jgi:hypothetical protein
MHSVLEMDLIKPHNGFNTTPISREGYRHFCLSSFANGFPGKVNLFKLSPNNKRRQGKE